MTRGFHATKETPGVPTSHPKAGPSSFRESWFATQNRRPEIERKLKAGFAFVFAQSTLTITDVDVRFLNPALAIAHVRWTMTGAKTPPGLPEPREGIQLQILTKQAGEWMIASFQNTNSVPEMPFPQGPPAGAMPNS